MQNLRSDKFLGNYDYMDGTIEFFGRLNFFLTKDSIVLNLGAGRGSWYYEDKCEPRRQIQNFRTKVAKYICADVDPVVLLNPTCENRLLIVNDLIDLPDESVDVVICDWVFEHVSNPGIFTQEINRVLKRGGLIAARTPHKYNYVSCVARILSNRLHSNLLKVIQPTRKSIDVFPTEYKLNTRGDLGKYFPNYSDYTYLYRSSPSYNLGNPIILDILNTLENLLPRVLVSHFLVFKIKN